MTPISELLQQLIEETQSSLELQKLKRNLEEQLDNYKDYKWVENIIKCKERIVVASDSTIRKNLIELHHSSVVGRHSGIQKHYITLKLIFLATYEARCSGFCPNLFHLSSHKAPTFSTYKISLATDHSYCGMGRHFHLFNSLVTQS